tara:strand:+ start:1511 stop:1681 length:171 start_codon:yes stop_codon:yes gene_type:complete
MTDQEILKELLTNFFRVETTGEILFWTMEDMPVNDTNPRLANAILEKLVEYHRSRA